MTKKPQNENERTENFSDWMKKMSSQKEEAQMKTSHRCMMWSV